MDIVSIVLAAPLTGNPTSGFVGDAFTFWSMDRIEGWFGIIFIGVVLGRGGRAYWVTKVEGQGSRRGTGLDFRHASGRGRTSRSRAVAGPRRPNAPSLPSIPSSQAAAHVSAARGTDMWQRNALL